MYSRLKQSKRALSFVLALVLMLNLVLSSGFFSVAVQATTEAEPDKVIYVDGIGSGNADGSSAENAFKTIAEAYLQIPANNTKTVIVICGEVHLDDSLVIANQNTYYTQKIIGMGEGADISYQKHAGTVVFTSKYGDEDYRDASVGFYLDDVEWNLLGDTTLENIDIRNDANRIVANYYTLTFGEGIGVYGTGSNRIALYVFLGYNNFYLYNGGADTVTGKSILTVRPHDVKFTMKSGTISYLNGTGTGLQGWNNKDSNTTYVPYNVALDIEAGTVTNLTLVANKDASVNDVKISIGSRATVGNLTFTSSTGTIKGTKTIAYTGKTGTVSVAGFDALELTNSNITVSSLDTVKSIQVTDSSNLTVQEAPAEAIPVTVTMASHKWTSNGALITAPAGTAENAFVLTNTDGCAWKYANGSNATWTIVDDPNAFYVDGVNGDDNNSGLSADEPLQTLAAAYAKIPANNEKTVIVICGEVHLNASLANASASVTKKVIGNENGGIKHTGTVVFTSEYKGNDYRGENVGLYLSGVEWNLLGDTVIENIDIKEKSTYIVANYYSFYMGEGLGDNLVADKIVLGFNGATMCNNDVITTVAHDIAFTMKSGTIGTLYGQGLNDQGYRNKDSASGYVPINVTLNIEGGTITDRVYIASNQSITSINNINLNIGGNANVGKLQGYYTHATSTSNPDPNPTVKGEINCIFDLGGKYKELYCNDKNFNLYVIDTANTAVSGAEAGMLKMTGYDIVEKIAQDPATKMRYAAVKSAGVYTAHPFNLTFSQIGINTIAGENDDEVAICLRGTYLANSELLNSGAITDYGICTVVDGVPGEKASAKANYPFDGKNLMHAYYDLLGSLTAEKIDSTVYYCTYMVINGETVYSSAVAKVTPSEVLAYINTLIKGGATVTAAQEARIKALMETNERVKAIFDCFQ